MSRKPSNDGEVVFCAS